LHQTQRPAVMLGKPRHHCLPSANKEFHRFERRRIVQPAMRRAVVARNRILNQFLKLAE
jgi:hypothetical protein